MGCVEADAIRLPEFLRKVSRSNGSPEKAKQFLTDYLRAHVERWPVPHLLRDARRSSEERKHPANPSCRFAQAQATGCQRCGSNSPILL